MAFNKANLLKKLWDEVGQLEQQHNFDPNNGYSQLKKDDFHRVMAYGYCEALKAIIDDIEYKNI
jgi:hypothetical protein